MANTVIQALPGLTAVAGSQHAVIHHCIMVCWCTMHACRTHAGSIMSLLVQIGPFFELHVDWGLIAVANNAP